MEDNGYCSMEYCPLPMYAYCVVCGEPVCADHTRLVDVGNKSGLEEAYCPDCDAGPDGDNFDA